MDRRLVFQIVDADTKVLAYLNEVEPQGGAPVESRASIARGGGHDNHITMSLADFRRMVAAIEHQF